MKEINYELLGKILSNEATPQERDQFQKWLELSRENKEIYEAYRVFYGNSTIKESEYRLKLENKPSPGLKSTWGYWAVAASVIFLMFFSVYFFADPFNKTSDTTISENKIVSYSNPNGKKSKILLPDSSVVWLNSGSKITYNENFTDSVRKIELTGEAFFEVAKDISRPFIVDVDDLQATVLGTTFNVSGYPENDLVIVSLASGKLMVKQEDNEEILLPGNGIEFSKKKFQLDKVSVDIERIAAWKNGILIFEEEDFESVVSRLQRWYGVEITVSGVPSPEWKFTGYFDREYLSNVLEVLCYGKNLNYKIEGKNVKIIKQ